MECVGRGFQHGDPPLTVSELATSLAVSTKLVQQIMQTLLAGCIVVEVAGRETAYAPARPIENITCYDILLALRVGKGQEPSTRAEPAGVEVRSEFQRIIEAERQASSAVSVLALVNRSESIELENPGVKAVSDRPSA